jgi:hypothetical protein
MAHITLSRIQKRSAISVELYISDSKELYDSLFAHREEIERAMGIGLDWRRLDDKKASRIVLEKEFGIDDQDDWPSMKRAFKPYL